MGPLAVCRADGPPRRGPCPPPASPGRGRARGRSVLSSALPGSAEAAGWTGTPATSPTPLHTFRQETCARVEKEVRSTAHVRPGWASQPLLIHLLGDKPLHHSRHERVQK